MLDGEMQFGWVLERGMLDTRILENTFGTNTITREQRLNRMPRMVLTLDINAPELDEQGNQYSNDPLGQPFDLGAAGGIIAAGTAGRFRTRRRAVGQYRIAFAKTDSLTLGAMAGRSVVAARWEGLSEGIYFIESESRIDPGLSFDATYQTSQSLADPNQYVATSTRPSWVNFGTKK